MHRYMEGPLIKILEELLEKLEGCVYVANEIVKKKRTLNPLYKQSGSPYSGHPFKGIFYTGAAANDAVSYTLYYGGSFIAPMLHCGSLSLYSVDGNSEFMDFFRSGNESFNATIPDLTTIETNELIRISSIRPGTNRRIPLNFTKHVPFQKATTRQA